MSIAARAKSMAASFGSAAQPSWCPECLRTVAHGMFDDNSIILELRTQCHDFWNACMAIAAAPRSPEDLRLLQSTFSRRARACKKRHADRSATRVSLQNMCNVFFDALFECVTVGLSVGERAVGTRTKPGQRFNKPGHWPTVMSELFPRGEKESVEAYVFWCCQVFSPMPLYTLRSLFRIARPVVFPLLLEEPLHAILMWALTETLEPGIVVEWPAGVAPCTKPEGWQLQSWLVTPPRRRKCSVCAAVFLWDIMYGPDIGLGDRVDFVLGYERPLLTAVLAAFARMHKTGDPHADKPYALLADYAEFLHGLAGLPPSDLPERVRVEVPKVDRSQSIPFLIYGYIARSSTSVEFPQRTLFAYRRYHRAAILPTGQRFNKPGYWPTSIAELFPRGEKESVEVYVFWCCQLFSTIPLYALRAFLRIARPIVFPLLMEEPLRAKVMWVLTEMLEPGIVVEWPAGVTPCTKPEGWQLQPWMANPPRRRKCSVCAAVFLSDILSGPDIGLGDRIYFTKGYERPLLTAVLAAFGRMHKTGDSVADKPYAMLAGYADVLHALLGLPPLDLPERVRIELPEEDHNQTIPFLIYGYLARSMTLRTCSNPECGLQEKFHGENRAFQLCGSCKMVRYCSKACQKRHWKMNLAAWGAKGLKDQGPAPHKVVCALICQVLARVSSHKDSQAFERDITAAVAAGDISDDDMWTLCSIIIIVDPVLPRLSQTTMLRMLLRGVSDDDKTKMDWKKACETRFNPDIECTTSEWQERLVANGAMDTNDPTKQPTVEALILAGF